MRDAVRGHGGRRPRRMLAILMIALVSGCGPARRVESTATPELAAYDVAPVPRDHVRDGGTLRLATTEFRTQWNYWHLGGADLDTARILGAMMPWLFRGDQNGRVTNDPAYLVRAEITRTRPKQVITYDLNPRARWSDGTPLGYRDFQALWRACRGRDPAYQITASTGYERIESVRRGTNDRQVVVTFARPFGEWRSLFSPLYPAKAIGGPAAWDRAWQGRVPVTAGPFRLERIDRTAGTLSMVRDPRWWGDRARLDRVIFRYLARDAMPGAFASGEIDAFDAGADAAAYRRARQVPGAVVRRAAGPDFSQLTFNGAAPALADVNVRRAAVDGHRPPGTRPLVPGRARRSGTPPERSRVRQHPAGLCGRRGRAGRLPPRPRLTPAGPRGPAAGRAFPPQGRHAVDAPVRLSAERRGEPAQR
jgi:peptide/nickel transport system substrate-binding protein